MTDCGSCSSRPANDFPVAKAHPTEELHKLFTSGLLYFAAAIVRPPAAAARRADGDAHPAPLLPVDRHFGWTSRRPKRWPGAEVPNRTGSRSPRWPQRDGWQAVARNSLNPHCVSSTAIRSMLAGGQRETAFRHSARCQPREAGGRPRPPPTASRWPRPPPGDRRRQPDGFSSTGAAPSASANKSCSPAPPTFPSAQRIPCPRSRVAAADKVAASHRPVPPTTAAVSSRLPSSTTITS